MYRDLPECVLSPQERCEIVPHARHEAVTGPEQALDTARAGRACLRSQFRDYRTPAIDPYAASGPSLTRRHHPHPQRTIRMKARRRTTVAAAAVTAAALLSACSTGTNSGSGSGSGSGTDSSAAPVATELGAA